MNKHVMLCMVISLCLSFIEELIELLLFIEEGDLCDLISCLKMNILEEYNVYYQPTVGKTQAKLWT